MPKWTTNQGRSAAERGYGSNWRRLRLYILERDPICRVCHRAPSTHVDHIVNKARGGTDAPMNLQGLCPRCHKSKTGKESREGIAPRRRPAERHPGLVI